MLKCFKKYLLLDEIQDSHYCVMNDLMLFHYSILCSNIVSYKQTCMCMCIELCMCINVRVYIYISAHIGTMLN